MPEFAASATGASPLRAAFDTAANEAAAFQKCQFLLSCLPAAALRFLCKKSAGCCDFSGRFGLCSRRLCQRRERAGRNKRRECGRINSSAKHGPELRTGFLSKGHSVPKPIEQSTQRDRANPNSRDERITHFFAHPSWSASQLRHVAPTAHGSQRIPRRLRRPTAIPHCTCGRAWNRVSGTSRTYRAEGSNWQRSPADRKRRAGCIGAARWTPAS
jgi:hypothetical protein